MTTKFSETPLSPHIEDLIVAAHPTTGTDDDEDDRDDEHAHAHENEASVREVDENMETPEEFEIDVADEPANELGDADGEATDR